MPLLTITVDSSDSGTFTLVLAGSIDSDTYNILEQKVDILLNPSLRTMIFDMKGVKYISSMGIKAILTSKEKIEKQGGALLMTNLQPQIRKVFDIIRAIPGQSIFTNRQELDQYLARIQQKEIDKRSPPK
ncbi:MAG: STAS domain-containing protein [Candidatus Omnitrophica bacterium]|nr:STAS domain-containing protein [Candidatus Omnitrophota bacterium]